MPFPFITKSDVHIVYDSNGRLGNDLENARIVEYEGLLPTAVDIVFCMTIGIPFAAFFNKVIVVPHGHTQTVAHVVAGGALAGKVFVRIFAGTAGRFDRHHIHYLRFARGTRFRSIRLRRSGFIFDIGECLLCRVFNGDIQIVDRRGLLLARTDNSTVFHLFADHHNGRTHRHQGRAELDFGTGFHGGVTRLADSGTDNRLHHVGGIGRKIRTRRRKNLDIRGKRKTRQGKNSGNKIFLLHAKKNKKNRRERLGSRG